MKAWQTRPLDAVYPVVFLDALVVKVREGNVVTNKAAHIAVGIDTDGAKHVLGIWVQSKEGASFWAQVCAELANRGVKDILIACCDGLTGLPEAIEATFPATVVQTCVVHLIRAATRFVSYADRKKFCAALRAVYTAVNADTAQLALLELAESPLGQKYPAAIGVWERAWDRFIPFLAFAPAVRKVLYTTNTIVIWSGLWGVLHVVDEVVGSLVLRDGRGYLPSSVTQILEELNVGGPCGDARLAA